MSKEKPYIGKSKKNQDNIRIFGENQGNQDNFKN